MTTPNLALPELIQSQSQPHVPINESLRKLDALVQLSVISRVSSLPGSPNEGDRYILTAADGGGQASDVAFYSGGWKFATPRNGWTARVEAEGERYEFGVGSPSVWSIQASGGGAALTVTNSGSPSTLVESVDTIIFSGAEVTDGGGGIAVVSIDAGNTDGANPTQGFPTFGEHDLSHGYNLEKTGVIITRGGSGSWKESRVESPNVFWDPRIGKYVMVFLGYSGTPSSPNQASLGFATSDDLESWTEDGGNPFFEPTEVASDPDENGCSAPFVWYEDGTYYLFYLGLTDTGLEGGDTSICLATSTDFNAWTRHGAVIEPLAATWRATKVWHPCVVKKGETYYLFFNASDGAAGGAHESIGFATSTNLIAWTVNDDDSPILDNGSSGQWDDVRVGDPFVYRIGQTWYMSYYANDGTLTQEGIAFTSDADFPLNWTKFSGNPVLAAGTSGTFDDTDAGRTCRWITPRRHYCFYTTSDGAGPALVQIAGAVDRSLDPEQAPEFIGCRVYHNTTQSISNNSSTAATFNTEEWDTDAIHDTGTNPTRFTCPTGKAGKWKFTYKVTFAANATGVRFVFLRKNGGTDANNIRGSTFNNPPNASEVTVVGGFGTCEMVAGDYVELFIFQNSGGSLNISHASDIGLQNNVEVQYLGT